MISGDFIRCVVAVSDAWRKWKHTAYRRIVHLMLDIVSTFALRYNINFIKLMPVHIPSLGIHNKGLHIGKRPVWKEILRIEIQFIIIG